MGQRLVINIFADDKSLASGYFHWNAYTGEAAKITKNIVDSFEDTKRIAKCYFYYDKDKSKEELEELEQRMTAYLLLENLGAGIFSADDEKKEVTELEKLCPYHNYCIGKNRNDGLIALTEDKIKEFNDLAEGTVDFDILYEAAKFDVFETTPKDFFIKINEHEIKEVNFDEIRFLEFRKIDEWYERISKMLIDDVAEDYYPYYHDEKEPDIYYSVIV